MDNSCLNDLILWMQSLQTQSEITLESVFTGRPIAETLQKIDPLFFDESWILTVPVYEVTANWRMKANNFRKIIARLTEYYSDRLARKLTPEWIVDPRAISESSDSESLCIVLKLTLGAALLGPNNQEFVPILLDQSQSVQVTSMNIVKEIEETLPSAKVRSDLASDDVTTAASRSAESCQEIDVLRSKFNAVEQECNHLRDKLRDTRSEKAALSSENESLRAKIEELNGGSIESESLRKQLIILRSKNDQMQEALYKAEHERDHANEMNISLSGENEALSAKNKELAVVESTLKCLKDELEEYRLRVQEYENLDAQIASYKSRMKEYNTQKMEIKVLQDKLDTYMHSAVDLDDERRTKIVLKTQVKSLEMANEELSKNLNDEIKKADKLEFENQQLQGRFKESEEYRERLRADFKKFKEEVLLKTRDGIVSNFDAEMSPVVLADEERLALKDEIIALMGQKKEVEIDLKLAQKRNDELEKKLNETKNLLESIKSDDGNLLLKQQKNNEKLSVTNARIEALFKQTTDEFEIVKREKKLLEEELLASKDSLKCEQDKLQRYLEKARRVIEDTDEQNRAVESGALSRHEFDSIRRERDSYRQKLETMRENLDRGHALREEEQRLLTSYFHNAMMHTQKQNSVFGRNSPEKSFISKQRQFGGFNFSSIVIALACSLLLLCFYWSGPLNLHSEISFSDSPPT